MYQQIAEDLQAQIESGALMPGAQLPTELELRDRYNSSTEHHPGRDQTADEPGPRWRRGQDRGPSLPARIDPFVTVLTETLQARSVGDERRVPVRGQQESPQRERSPCPGWRSRCRPPRSPPTPCPAGHRRSSAGMNSVYIDDMPWALQTSFYPMDFIPKGATRLLMAEDIERREPCAT